MKITPYKAITVLASVVVVGVGLASLTLIGSPAKQRILRLDGQRVQDLQQIYYGVGSFAAQQDNTLPKTLDALVNDPGFSYYSQNMSDPETKQPYEYLVTGTSTYQLCATFSQPSEKTSETSSLIGYPYPQGPAWDHPAGKHCYNLEYKPAKPVPMP